MYGEEGGNSAKDAGWVLRMLFENSFLTPSDNVLCVNSLWRFRVGQ